MGDLHPALVAGIVLVALVIVSRIVRFVSLRLLRLVAERGRQGRTNAWTVRLPRVGVVDDQLELFRRDQRVQATAMLLSRVVNTLLALVGLVLVLASLDVDIVWFVGSAGFLGAGLAFGAQHSLHDFITGLHVLLEDRFFEGDTIEIGSGEHRTIGIVERVGMFSTRLRDEHLTLHIANRELVQVRNHSQRGFAVHLDLALDGQVNESAIRRAVEGALDHVTPGQTPGIVVDNVRPGAERVAVEARLTERLSTQQHEELADEVLRRLEGDD